MATFKSEEVTLRASAQNVFDKLSNLEGLGNLIKEAPLDQVPAEQRAMLDQVSVSADRISFPGGPAGEITLRLAEAVAPSLIRMEGEGTPVPLSMTMHIEPLLAEESRAYVEIDIKIPAMLKPMVAGPLQKMADQFAEMLPQVIR